MPCRERTSTGTKPPPGTRTPRRAPRRPRRRAARTRPARRRRPSSRPRTKPGRSAPWASRSPIPAGRTASTPRPAAPPSRVSSPTGASGDAPPPSTGTTPLALRLPGSQPANAQSDHGSARRPRRASACVRLAMFASIGTSARRAALRGRPVCRGGARGGGPGIRPPTTRGEPPPPVAVRASASRPRSTEGPASMAPSMTPSPEASGCAGVLSAFGTRRRVTPGRHMDGRAEEHAVWGHCSSVYTHPLRFHPAPRSLCSRGNPSVSADAGRPSPVNADRRAPVYPFPRVLGARHPAGVGWPPP